MAGPNRDTLDTIADDISMRAHPLSRMRPIPYTVGPRQPRASFNRPLISSIETNRNDAVHRSVVPIAHSLE
jgi:hypothetical protein